MHPRNRRAAHAPSVATPSPYPHKRAPSALRQGLPHGGLGLRGHGGRSGGQVRSQAARTQAGSRKGAKSRRGGGQPPRTSGGGSGNVFAVRRKPYCRLMEDGPMMETASIPENPNQFSAGRDRLM